MKVRVNMTRDVICVAPDDSLADAYELMRENEFAHLPVVDGSILVGILSHRDILLRAELVGDEVEVPDLPVSHAMTEDVITCSPSSNIADVASLMIERRIHSLPVVTGDGDLVGLVTSTDLLEILKARGDLRGAEVIPFNYTIKRPIHLMDRQATGRSAAAT